MKEDQVDQLYQHHGVGHKVKVIKGEDGRLQLACDCGTVIAVFEKNDMPPEKKKRYQELADEIHNSEGEVEIDENARLVMCEDGCYVQAWVWVYDPDKKDEEEEEEEED
jgi:hypothetical protein